MVSRVCRTPISVLALLALTMGCGGDNGSAGDAGETADASRLVDGAPDAAPDPDATPDGDATPDPDAAPDLDAGVPCSVGGVSGVCMDVSLCAGTSTPGYCPGPSNIQCCTPPDPTTCDPADHPQPNAGLTEPAGVGGCPSGMIPVDTFCIDRYEASLWRILPNLTTEPWSPYQNPGTERVMAVSLPGAVPQGYINGDQAADACAEAGKRLCTDAEWLRACQGPGGWTYPYGNTRQPGDCADARSPHPVVEYFGTTDPWIWSELGNACINQLPDSLYATGAHADCVTAEGAYDMMGNLHEWTSDPAGTFRGGFYVDTVINGNGCLYATTAHNTLHWDYSTGFRCCAQP